VGFFCVSLATGFTGLSRDGGGGIGGGRTKGRLMKNSDIRGLLLVRVSNFRQK
jgi:hypothetical protein